MRADELSGVLAGGPRLSEKAQQMMAHHAAKWRKVLSHSSKKHLEQYEDYSELFNKYISEIASTLSERYVICDVET